MSARRTDGPSSMCEYIARAADGTAATLRLTFTQRNLTGGMQQTWADSLRRAGGTPLVGVANRAFVFVNGQPGCRSVVARRASDILELARCGRDYDSAGTARSEDELVLRLIGRR